jgi:hypothetical protein
MHCVKKVGSKGSIGFFYEGHLCSIFALSEQFTSDYLFNWSNDMVIKDLKKGYTIKRQIQLSKLFCSVFYYRRVLKQKVASYDHRVFVRSLLFLIKTGELKNDDKNGYMILKKPKRKIKHNPVLV